MYDDGCGEFVVMVHVITRLCQFVTTSLEDWNPQRYLDCTIRVSLEVSQRLSLVGRFALKKDG